MFDIKPYAPYTDCIPDASGGIARMEELAELQAMGCHAAILGKSIYTGAIDLAEAVRRYQD